MVIEVVPAGLLSTAYDLLVDGLPGGRIHQRAMSLRAVAQISTPGLTFTALREQVLGGRCVLQSSEGVLRASGVRESFWREHYQVRFGDSTLHLRQRPFSFTGAFAISDDSGDSGSIGRESPFSRRMRVEYTTAAPPLEITGFLVWIVLMVRRREASLAG